MAQKTAWRFTGGRATVVARLGDESDRNAWHQRLLNFVERIAQSHRFEVKDNGYQRVPVFCRDGVEVWFQGRPFRIWSDIPGEIVLTHEQMSNGLAGDLLIQLERLWSPPETRSDKKSAEHDDHST